MTGRRPGRPRSRKLSQPVPSETLENGDEPEELESELDGSVIVDQGDGVRTLRRGPRRSPEDQETHECPDEPPEGWGHT